MGEHGLAEREKSLGSTAFTGEADGKRHGELIPKAAQSSGPGSAFAGIAGKHAQRAAILSLKHDGNRGFESGRAKIGEVTLGMLDGLLVAWSLEPVWVRNSAGCDHLMKEVAHRGTMASELDRCY